MKQIIIRILIAAAALGLAASSHARSWRVELDGSGDFSDVQLAVDAAAPGDTILIGPGRFDTFHPIAAPAWTEATIVGVLKDSLTFIGSGQEVTVLGPVLYRGEPGEEPKVFCSFGGYSGRIENMTIENVEAGVYWEGGTIAILNCTFRAANPNYFALQIFADHSLVRGCTINPLDGGTAVLIHHFSGNMQDCEIADCAIQGARYGVSAGYGAHGVAIHDSTFDVTYWGITFEAGASGSVDRCRVYGNHERSLMVWNNSIVEISDTELDGGLYGLNVSSGSSVTGVNLVVSNTRDAALYFGARAQAAIHNSHFLPATGLAFDCYSYSIPLITIDLTGNYWGTTDSLTIANMIHDYQDDPSIHCQVVFEPFANGPVPTESTSWGDLKALFR